MKKNFLELCRKTKNLTQEEVGRVLGIKKQMYSKIESGKVNLHPKHWKKLAQVLGVTEDQVCEFTAVIAVEKYEDDHGESITDTLKRSERVRQNKKYGIPEAEIVQIDKNKLFPVVSEAAAAECNTAIMPLMDCINNHAEDSVYFAQGMPGDFVIRVSGLSMMPWYPGGTLLLVRPYKELANGKRVVAVLDDGEIVFKIFLKTSDSIALVSIDNQGKDFVFPASGQGIRYICRVVASQRDEDALDSAMTEAGIHHRWEDKLKQLESTSSVKYSISRAPQGLKAAEKRSKYKSK